MGNQVTGPSRIGIVKGVRRRSSFVECNAENEHENNEFTAVQNELVEEEKSDPFEHERGSLHIPLLKVPQGVEDSVRPFFIKKKHLPCHDQMTDTKCFYRGNLKDGFREGAGCWVLYEKCRYEGMWKNNKRNGYGQGVHFESAQRYRGEWIDDLPDGIGEWRCDEKQCRYIGFWKSGRMEGVGRYDWGNNVSYSGYWRDGLKHGFGILQMNKLVVTGYWYEDHLHGRAVIELWNGFKFDGCFSHDKRHGPGSILAPQGETIDGIWTLGYVWSCRKTFSNNFVHVHYSFRSDGSLLCERVHTPNSHKPDILLWHSVNEKDAKHLFTLNPDAFTMAFIQFDMSKLWKGLGQHSFGHSFSESDHGIFTKLSGSTTLNT